MRRSFLLAVAAAALASGCVIIVDEDHQDGGNKRPQSCAAGDYTHLIGRDEAEINRERLPRSFRVVCADCTVTLDHNPERLTIQLDDRNRVVSAACG